jgi:hypothetical protein
MTGGHGPPLFSLNYNVASVAVNLMRRREADSHHGQGRDRPEYRPHRLWHSKQPIMSKSHLQRGASIDRCSGRTKLAAHASQSRHLVCD